MLLREHQSGRGTILDKTDATGAGLFGYTHFYGGYRAARPSTRAPEAIITHRLPLSQAPRGYELFEKKLEDCRKVVLIPDWVAGRTRLVRPPFTPGGRCWNPA